MQDRFRSSRMFDFAIMALIVLCLAVILHPAKAATPETGYSAAAPRADAPPGTPAERPAKALHAGQKAIMMKTEPTASQNGRSPMAAPKSQASVSALVSAHSAAVRLEDPGDVRATVAQSGTYKQTISKLGIINRGDGAGGNFNLVASR